MSFFARKKTSFILIVVALILTLASFAPLSVPFSSRSKMLIRPELQWELIRNAQGNLITSTRNHITGAIAAYSIAEFNRGDAVVFHLKPNWQGGSTVSKNDTIGILYSNEEQSKIISLEAELKVLEAELHFFNTGQKPEDVANARNEVLLAEQELENQRLLSQRAALLFRDSVIAQQEYDLAINALRVREISLELAKTRYASITTGDKPEQIQLIETRIYAMQQQLKQAKERISYFTLLAPFDGTIVMRQGFSVGDTLLEIHGGSSFVGVAPILLSDRKFLKIGDEVEITHYGEHKGIKGSIQSFDQVSKLVNGQAVVFCTVNFSGVAIRPMMGELLEIKIRGDEIPATVYFSKLFTTP
ncbi:MAG: HlyD family secretion protein [Bacteroidia bacterium]